MDRPAWRLLVDAATSSGHAPERERETIGLMDEWIKFRVRIRGPI